MFIYIQLFCEFFRIGLFALGGGLATVPFLEQLIDKYGWITSADLLDLIAIAESTPGPIGVNAATYVGFNVAGFPGSITTVLGLVTPSIIIIIIVAHFFEKFKKQKMVQDCFYGIRPVVAGLIGAAGFNVAKMAIVDLKTILVCSAFLVIMSKWKKHPILYIALGAGVGIILGL